MRRTYLDWAAAAPVRARALRAFTKALGEGANPASPHQEGREASRILEDARVRIARLAGVKGDAVIFTSGATEANALGTVGVVRALLEAGRRPDELHALYLPSAHASTRGSMDELRKLGVAVEPLGLLDGKIDLIALKAQLRPQTALITLEAVCGETGTRFDVRGVRRLVGARSPVHLHVDASQLPLAESFERMRLGADTLALDAQKVGGVRGVGALIAPRLISIAPLMRGGGQERALRPGTPAPALAAAFASALEEAAQERDAFVLRAGALRDRLLRALADLSGLSVNGGEERVAHILNLSLRGRDTDYLQHLLDEAGFAVSTRSACATDEEGSTAVLALTGDLERAGSTLRVSWGSATRARDIDRFARALLDAVRFLDSNPV